jgi:hypothetical protein
MQLKYTAPDKKNLNFINRFVCCPKCGHQMIDPCITQGTSACYWGFWYASIMACQFKFVQPYKKSKKDKK